LFANPIHLIEPVLDQCMSEAHYLPLLTEFLPKLMTLLRSLAASNGDSLALLDALTQAEANFKTIDQACRHSKHLITPSIAIDMRRLFEAVNKLDV
jgi:hypothetical protein